MTIPIAAGSPRKAKAMIFAAELRRIMRVRKVGRRTLAKAMHMSSDSIVHAWRSGNTLPRIESAVALAEALDHPKLLTMVKAARIGICQNEHCRKPFENEGGKPKQFCSDQCREAVQKLRAGTSTRERAVIYERRLGDANLAVKQMCHGCEPEGICHEAGCPLRSLSPLPLIVIQRDVDTAVEAPGPYGSPENRAKTLAAQAAAQKIRWAEPGAREEQAARTRQMHRDGTIGGPRRRPQLEPFDPLGDLLKAAEAVYAEEISAKMGQPARNDNEFWWALWRAIIQARRVAADPELHPGEVERMIEEPSTHVKEKP